MANIEFKGLEEYRRKLQHLSALSEERVIGRAVYDGAEVAANMIRQEIKSLPTEERWRTKAYPKSGISKEEKDGLIASFGITPMLNDSGFVNVKLGFDGYQGEPTRKYPRGKPNQMIARSVERGTSFLLPNPFMKRAIAKVRKQSKEAMKKRVEQEIEQIMN